MKCLLGLSKYGINSWYSQMVSVREFGEGLAYFLPPKGIFHRIIFCQMFLNKTDTAKAL